VVLQVGGQYGDGALLKRQLHTAAAPSATKTGLQPYRYALIFMTDEACCIFFWPTGFYIVMRRAMDHWLNNAPGLIFSKELSTWFIMNRNCEPVIWIEGESELAWYFACVQCGANDRTQLPVIKKFQRTEGPPKYSEQNLTM
jgi:hypothetical protein